MRRRIHTKHSAAAERVRDLSAVAAAFNGFRPAAESSIRVRSVPTIFSQFDHGVRVGGLPTERISLVHGPSGQGKTYFTLGLARSFLRAGNPVLFLDAERTLEAGFTRLAFGPEVYRGHGYDDPRERPPTSLWWWDKPTTYEETRVQVRDFCNRSAKARKAAPDLSGLVVVDSIRKLVPRDQWEKLLELNKRAAKDEKARDRAAQLKAQMNAAWCDELIPLLEQTGTAAVIIAREMDDPDADQRSRMFGTAYKTGGGSALYYDASLDIRVDRARYVTKEASQEGTRPTVYGERHRITIKKSKVSGKEDKSIVCYFHSSNGNLVPEGFDPARDLVELGRRFGVIKGESWLKWADQKWQGEHAAVKKLHSSPEVMARLEADVRAKFQTAAVTEVTADGEVS